MWFRQESGLDVRGSRKHAEAPDVGIMDRRGASGSEKGPQLILLTDGREHVWVSLTNTQQGLNGSYP